MATDDSRTIRPLHKLEQYSSARHHLGLYHCVIVTARYEQTDERDENKPHPVYNALIPLIRRHGMLRVGIADDDTKQPYFCHVVKVDLRNQVDFKTIKCSSPQEYEMKLAELQERRHNQPFPDLTTVPPWRLTIVKADIEGNTGSTFEDFVFAFHHSLLDGPSARLFHEQLVASLNYPSCSIDLHAEQTHELEFPAKPDLPPPREEVIPSNLTKKFVASTLWKALGPKWLQPTPDPWWAGEDIDLALPLKTRILPIDIPSETLTTLLKACREKATTLTCLIHALILASLSRRLDPQDAPSFASTTPIDYRLLPIDAVIKAYKKTLSNCVTASTEKHPAINVSAFRAPGSDLDALVWSNAQRIGKDLTEMRSRLPVNDPVMLFQFVGNLLDYCREKDHTKREASWEVSNIGIVNGVPFESEDHRSWRIARVLFSNSAAVIGPALSVNVASVPGESLTMSIVWQEGVVPEEVARGLASDLVASASNYAAEGTFEGRDAVR
ncbi:hypothetical protein NLU13_5331 [Sarocladium strictum]|uniref:Alcohol acetyltransferase n=1 Tax=Sarocladium strictum TaxID=5046 RepID=A0AA39L7J0_SARSR|nr:hypothetical protein NLU13_5331 [Sarocladium strictum]